jgi:hypothetical protein
MKFLLLLLAILAPLSARCQAGYFVTLAWNAVSGWGPMGYFVYSGDSSRSYTNKVDAGQATSLVLSNLVGGATYYLAVTTYDSQGLESDFSAEAVYRVVPPAPALKLGEVLVSAPVVFWGSTNLVDWTAVQTNYAYGVFPATNQQFFFRTGTLQIEREP